MKLGLDVPPENFPEINLEDTPFYDLYEDYHKDSKGQPAGPAVPLNPCGTT